MQAIKSFFAGINWYKATLGLIILSFGALLFVTTLIVPYVREVKKQNTILNVEKTSLEKAKSRFEEESKKLADFKKENARFINGFHNRFNPDAFSTGYSDVSFLEFTKTANDEIKEYNATSYNVTAGFNSPRKFFDLLQTLGDSSFITQLTYPIVIASKNGSIYSSFGIRTLVLTDEKAKRKPSVEEGSAEPVAKEEQAPADGHGVAAEYAPADSHGEAKATEHKPDAPAKDGHKAVH